MEEQYESGYMCINDIEDYSDQALQEIAKQICARVRKEFYFQIRFKQDLTALLADVRNICLEGMYRARGAIFNQRGSYSSFCASSPLPKIDRHAPRDTRVHRIHERTVAPRRDCAAAVQ